MYRGNTKGADANFMYPLSRTPAQSIDKAQNTMADNYRFSYCRNWYKSVVNENSKNNSDYV